METGNPRSTASIAGHPVHPIAVMFPITLFIGAWMSDLFYWQSGDLFWATLGLLALGTGLVSALVAAVFGLVDYFGDSRIRSLPSANRHLMANVTIIAVQVGNFFWRINGGPEYVVPTGVVLSTASVLLLGYSGWKGAKLVYEHGVGVDVARGASERDRVDPVDLPRVGRQGL